MRNKIIFLSFIITLSFIFSILFFNNLFFDNSRYISSNANNINLEKNFYSFQDYCSSISKKSSKDIKNEFVDCLYSYIKPDYSNPTRESIQSYSDIFNKELKPENHFLCHLLNHKLGKNYVQSSNSYNLLLEYKISSCNDGFSHGVVEYIKDFDYSVKKPFSNLFRFCLSYSSILDTTSCVHGFGHLIYQGFSAGKFSLSDGYSYCTFSNNNIYTLSCATGISMSVMMNNFMKSNPYNPMCNKLSSLENISCLLYPTISLQNDPIKLKSRYCDYLDNEDFIKLCEIGVINNLGLLHPPEEVLQYCMDISLARRECLHNFMLVLPSVFGMDEYRKFQKILKNEDYLHVTDEEILAFSNVEINDIFSRVKL